MAPSLRLRELKANELSAALPLLRHLNPQMTPARFSARLKAMLPQGYRMVGAFDGPALIGVSGFWLRTRFWCGKQLDIDNFVVLPASRGRGVGEALLAWLEKTALHEKCELIVLDTYVSAFLAHRFYYRHGFTSTGYHMTKVPGSNNPFGQSNQ